MPNSSRKPGDGLIGAGFALMIFGVVVYLLVTAMDGEASPAIVLGWVVVGLALVLAGRARRRRS